MDQKSIYIIIPVHNRREHTRVCLNALRKQTTPNFKVVIIDDGSTDNTEKMLKEEYPEVELIKGDGNLWWSEATNLGVKFSLEQGAQFILTLNNDTIPAPNFIENMLKWVDKQPDTLLGALAIDANTRRAVYGGETVDWMRATYKSILPEIQTEKLQGIHKVTHYPGRGLLIPSKVFRDIGFYEAKKFPQKGADEDFTFRAAKKGYEIFCNYDAIIYIYPSASGDADIRNQKNIKNYFKHLFSIRGGGNLKVFFWFAIRNCPPQYLLFFLSVGFLRRFLGYPFHWLIELLGVEKHA